MKHRIKGDIGNTPDITVNATVDNTVGTPSVTVTESGTPEAPEINLSFHNLKGEPGDVSGSVTGVKGNNEADYRQGLVNLTPENIGAPSTSGTYEDLVVGSATSFTRHPLTSDDDLDNFKNEGYYVWAASQPQNSPCAFASMIIMWASSNNYPKQIVFRQGSMGNASGQYTSDEIWLRSYNVDNGVWTDWVLIPTLRYLTSNFSNRNLLVNPTFEINQREQVRYTGNANYTVDRWKSISANNIIIPLTRGGVRFINGYNSNSYIKQILEEDYSGLKLTFSANVSAINAGSARMAMYYTTADNTNTWTLINGGLTIDNSGVHSLTVTVPKSATAISADLGGTGFADIEFLWAKLEISPFATRFEPPNIAEELAKCQRYYQTGYENNGKRITKHYSNIVDILIPKEIIKAGVLNIVVTLLAMGVAIKTWNIEPIILKECNSGFQCYAELEVLKQAIDRKEQTISELIAKINNLEEIATDLKLQVANLWALHEA